jgi:hypothetical protein
VQTTFSVEETIAVEAGLASLKGEQATLTKWGLHSVELALHIDDLELLCDRLQRTHKRLRESFMSERPHSLRNRLRQVQHSQGVP